MKKICMVFVVFVFFNFSIFGYADEQEEVDFLLFMPDSSNQFVDEELALEHLDNVAKFLIDREPSPGQVHVDGYAAVADNDIESVNLSMDRALFVINELQKRGVPEYLFSDPLAFGSVDYWGSNTNENDRGPNRRVRILLDGQYLTPETLEAFNAEKTIIQKNAAVRINLLPLLIFMLVLFLIALIALIICCALKNKAENKGLYRLPSAGYVVVNLEDEIRSLAYELYLKRNGKNEDANEDWCLAVPQVCARYESAGYKTFFMDGYWWARR